VRATRTGCGHKVRCSYAEAIHPTCGGRSAADRYFALGPTLKFSYPGGKVNAPEVSLRGVGGWSACKPRSVRRGLAVYGRAFIPPCRAWAIIYLGPASPRGSCSLPGARGRRAASRPEGLRSCLALLRVGVAWPPALLPAPVVSYTTFSPLPARTPAVCLCGPVPGFPRPGVARHPALRSADFPRRANPPRSPGQPAAESIIPAGQGVVNRMTDFLPAVNPALTGSV